MYGVLAQHVLVRVAVAGKVLLVVADLLPDLELGVHQPLRARHLVLDLPTVHAQQNTLIELRMTPIEVSGGPNTRTGDFLSGLT